MKSDRIRLEALQRINTSRELYVARELRAGRLVESKQTRENAEVFKRQERETGKDG